MSRLNRSHKNTSEGLSNSHHPFFAKSINTVQTKKENPFFQTKLSIGKAGDKYEKEADAVANTVVNQKQTTPLIQQKKISGIQRLTSGQEEEKLGTNDARMRKDKEIQEKPEIQRMCPECEKESGLQRMTNDEKNDEELVQQKSESGATASASLSGRIENSAGKGKQLPPKTLTEMNSSFGTDFSHVNVHTGSDAVQMNKELSAQAFTHGNDIYFNTGKFRPESQDGKLLLAHELTHSLQQNNSIQRQSGVTADVKKTEVPKINYKTAKARNKYFSKPDSLGWESKLETVAGGLYKGWFELWRDAKHDEFADAVAQFQASQGMKKKEIDGVLGLGTWAKIGGYGEAIAGQESVKGEKAQYTCTLAAEERIKRGHQLAKGTTFTLPKDKDKSTFNTILQTIEGKMGEIDEIYRGTGAAGAMVYAGLGTFVPEANIWTGGLRPGAAMQVWGNRDAFNLLRKGVVEYKKKKGVTRTRPISPSDANFYGTSFVFVRYDDPKKPTKMQVRHFGTQEWKSKSDYAVWVAANIN